MISFLFQEYHNEKTLIGTTHLTFNTNHKIKQINLSKSDVMAMRFENHFLINLVY